MTEEDIARVRLLSQEDLMEEWHRLSEVAGVAAQYDGALQAAFEQPEYF